MTGRRVRAFSPRKHAPEGKRVTKEAQTKRNMQKRPSASDSLCPSALLKKMSGRSWWLRDRTRRPCDPLTRGNTFKAKNQICYRFANMDPIRATNLQDHQARRMRC